MPTNSLLMALPLCYADRTLVATMFETLTDINSFSPSQYCISIQMNCLIDNVIYVTVAATADLCYLVRIGSSSEEILWFLEANRKEYSVLLSSSQEVSFIFSDAVGVLSVFISLCVYLLLF